MSPRRTVSGSLRPLTADQAVHKFLAELPDAAEDLDTIAGSLAFTRAQVAGALARLCWSGVVAAVRPDQDSEGVYYRLAIARQQTLF